MGQAKVASTTPVPGSWSLYIISEAYASLSAEIRLVPRGMPGFQNRQDSSVLVHDIAYQVWT